ncbi:hypothetical protein ACIBF5_22950 [Micromonospora sp. NPDC050417]|uniref:hypothetical protein n=1 Tax=Micromonospora sp. NPDC050417 TaxID=3364280 RepID=UPI003795BA2B
MSGQGFGPGDLDEFGCPVWIAELGWQEHADPNHLVHVVRHLDPADALVLLGADRQAIKPCVLPTERPDSSTIPRAAIGPADPTAVLIAGRTGDWTFVYDDLGYTLFSFHLPERPPPLAAQTLSTEGGIAATSNTTINGQTGFAYAVDGTIEVVLDSFELAEPDGDLPAEVRAAIDAAGRFDADEDIHINMRVLCALAGLPRTLDDLRATPLLIAPLN